MKKQFCESYLANIPDDEELFILRAQDLLAPMVVEHWCELAAKLHNTKKIPD